MLMNPFNNVIGFISSHFSKVSHCFLATRLILDYYTPPKLEIKIRDCTQRERNKFKAFYNGFRRCCINKYSHSKSFRSRDLRKSSILAVLRYPQSLKVLYSKGRFMQQRHGVNNKLRFRSLIEINLKIPFFIKYS